MTRILYFCSGTDVAKEAADIILLDKDLQKLAEGVIIGRTTFGELIIQAYENARWCHFECLLASHMLEDAISLVSSSLSSKLFTM